MADRDPQAFRDGLSPCVSTKIPVALTHQTALVRCGPLVAIATVGFGCPWISRIPWGLHSLSARRIQGVLLRCPIVEMGGSDTERVVAVVTDESLGLLAIFEHPHDPVRSLELSFDSNVAVDSSFRNDFCTLPHPAVSQRRIVLGYGSVLLDFHPEFVGIV